MVLWQASLRVSWRSQWLSLLLHGIVAAVVLLIPWPLSYTPLWMLLLSLVLFDCVRSQRHINSRQGEAKLMVDNRFKWKNMEWDIIGEPWIVRSGMVLRLRRYGRKRHLHLWLAADSMDEKEWRNLRRLVTQSPASSPH